MRTLPYALMALLTLTAGCGGGDSKDGGTDPEGDTPTVTEVTNMMAALSAISSLAFSGGGRGGDAIAMQSGTITYNDTVDCPNGGSTTGNGNYSYSLSGSTYTYNYTLTQSYNGCKANGNGTVYTFNGQGITLTLTMTINSANSTYSYNLHESGNINWAGGNKGGACPVNITASFGWNGQTYTNVDYSGTFCGVSV